MPDMSAAASTTQEYKRLTQYDVDVICAKHDRLWSARMGGARAVFAFCDISGLSLTGRNLCDADFTGAVMVGCDLRKTKLDNANLYGADMQGADLTDASLRRADLRGSSLRGANLTGADMFEADLRDADMVYIYSTCFASLMERLSDKLARELAPGALVSTATFPLQHPAFELVRRFELAWTPVYLQRRRRDAQGAAAAAPRLRYEPDSQAWENAVRAQFAAYDAGAHH